MGPCSLLLMRMNELHVTFSQLIGYLVTLSVYVSRSNMEGPWRDVCQRVMQSVPHTETAQTASVQVTGVSEKKWIKREGGE